MKPTDPNQNSDQEQESLEQEAADWQIKIARGMTEEERSQYQIRIAEIPVLKELVEEMEDAWDTLGSLSSEDVRDLYPAPKDVILSFIAQRGPVLYASLGLVALVVLSFSFYFIGTSFKSSVPATVEAPQSHPTTQLLPDHSIARLNVGTEIETDFSGTQRRISLKSGEAHFKVTKDPERPFVVEAHGVEIVAVGTSFNVKTHKDKVGLLVTEGLVQVKNRSGQDLPNSKTVTNSVAADYGYYVASGQRAEVIIRQEQNQLKYEFLISGTAPREIDKLLAWRQPLLTLEGDSLGKIAENFRTKTGVDLLIVEPELRSLKIGGRFSSDDPTRFLEILRINYDIPWYEREDGTLVVGKN